MSYRPLSLSGYGVDGADKRSESLENPSVSLVDPKAWAQIFGDWRSAAGVSVDYNVAMSVPAVWCAVTFLGGCMASLPLKLHRKSVNGKDTLDNTNMAKMLSGTVNDEVLTSFNWRRDMMTSALLPGRGLTYIERTPGGDARFLWPFQVSKTTIRRRKGRLSYNYRDTTAASVESYGPADVIDIKYLGALDGVDAFSPVEMLKDTIGLAVALRRFSSRFFLNGGVPPLALNGPAASPAAAARATSDMAEVVKQASRDENNWVYVPLGHTLTPIGFNPEKSQLLDSQRHIVEEVSRMYNVPPSFLHSLMNMPFATVEQQDLNVIKHNIAHWCEQWEQELNAKLFGNARGRYVEFDLNGLMRGDFLSRIQGYVAGIQGALFKPNEARRRENLPDAEGGDRLYVNGAVVPVTDGKEDTTTTGAPAGEQGLSGDPASDPTLTEPAGKGAGDPDRDPDDETET